MSTINAFKKSHKGDKCQRHAITDLKCKALRPGQLSHRADTGGVAIHLTTFWVIDIVLSPLNQLVYNNDFTRTLAPLAVMLTVVQFDSMF